MNEISTSEFADAIAAMHGASAVFLNRDPVVEHFDGESIWRGEVLVFLLSGHPTAAKCFAWEVDGEITAVLAEGPIQTALDAVRASILADGSVEPEA